MMEADTERECFLERVVFDGRENSMKFVFIGNIQETPWVIFHSAKGNQVLCRQSRLSSRGNKDNDRLVGRVRLDGQESRTIHGLHKRAESPNLWETLNVNLKRNRSR